MAVKRYTANADTTITNAFKSDLTQRGTDANMGASDILEIFSLYGQNGGTSSELERILIKFPISEISADRTATDIPASGSVQFYLRMYNAPHSQTLPRNFTLSAHQVTTDWQEGIGLDMEEYKDKTYGNAGATWMSASNTTEWTIVGGDYSATEYKQFFPIGTEDLELNITPLVEDWIGGTANYGLEVKLTSSDEAYYASYYPREAVYFDKLAFLSGSGNDVSSSSGKDTFSAWVYRSEAAEMYICNWLRTSTSNKVTAKALRVYTGGNVAFTQYIQGGISMEAVTIASLPLNTWTHVGFSHDYFVEDGTSTVVYIDGISQSCTVVPGSSSTDPPYEQTDFCIGSSRANSAPDPTFIWSGSIDDASYYNRILTETEVLEIYNGGCPNDLKSLTASSASLQHWWINGDDPRDTINFATSSAGTVSIYDQVGTYNLYATGSGDMAIVGSVCAGGTDIFGRSPPSAQLINVDGSTLNYYTKKFFAHSSEFFFKRPVIEARWDSALKDDRGRLHLSSTLLPVEDNTYTLYLYNIFGGRKRDIPSVGTGEIYVQIYNSPSNTTPYLPTAITGGWVSTGIYSASFECSGSDFAVEVGGTGVNDRWWISGSQPDASYNESNVLFSGLTSPILAHLNRVQTSTPGAVPMMQHPSNFQYWSNITNLQSNYTPTDQIRLRLYTRLKDWSPTIYTVATQDIETTTIPSASYQIYRVVDDLIVLAYGTGSDNSTMMSYDIAGNYFDLDMNLFEPDYAYGIKIAFYNENSWVEQPYTWKFRIEDLNIQ